MKLSTDHRALILKFATAFPLATTGGDASPSWTHRLCEQLAFSFPTDGWGHKSASPTRPHSADAIALRSPFVCWDIINNSGTPAATLQLDGESIDIAGQTFEPVTPVNHLRIEPPTPEPPTPEPPTSNLEVRVAALEEAARAVAAALGHI